MLQILFGHRILRIQNTSHTTKHFPESKTLPRIQKPFQESRTHPRIQNTFKDLKHFPGSKTLPTLQNTSQHCFGPGYQWSCFAPFVQWGDHWGYSGAAEEDNIYYYLFKIFPRFWLVKTTRIIHHNQLPFTKFGENLRLIEAMRSKVQPAADYWPADRENLGTRLCYIFWWAEKQRAKWRSSFKNEEIFWLYN